MTGKTYLYSFFTFFICLFSIRTYSQQLPKREFRGVWVATIGNIDWPSVKASNNVALQKQEFIDLLDRHRSAGLNAIILQVRPAADAFYAKSREPWSRYLTGKQGQAPTPFYDPLQFAIEEAHKRGMELHAWFNPYRASTTLNPAHFSEDHITKRHPEWFFIYAGKKLFNPGLPEVRKYIIDVIMDVVKNYDVDGIHFDDYFYPYPDSRNTSVPDQLTFAQYNNGIKNIEDWRRDNVNMLVRDLGIAIKRIKPYVKYGISPCGVWDNKENNSIGSETRGLSAYRELYADGVKWMQEGWIDYINPQIYFPFKNRAAAYEVLVSWWQRHTYGRHFYVGHGAYRVTENKIGWTDKSQIPRQVRHLREEHDVEGSIYFSSKSLTDNLVGLQDSMRNDLYRTPALPPTMPWLDSIPPNAPFGLLVKASANGKMNTLFWQKPDAASDGESAYGYVVYRFAAGERVNIKDPSKIIFITYDADKLQYTDDDVKQHQQYKYVVTAIDRMKNESRPSDSREVNEET